MAVYAIKTESIHRRMHFHISNVHSYTYEVSRPVHWRK